MPSIGTFSQGSSGKLFIPVRNVSASSLTLGYAVAYAVGGNSVDGNAAVLAASATTADLPGFIGIASADIASNGYGLVQCLGFAASVFISRTNTSVTINQGDPLVPGAAAGGLTSLAPSYAASGFKFVLASNVPVTTSLAVASAYLSGIVRCI